MGPCWSPLASIILCVVELTLLKIRIRSKWKQRSKANEQLCFMVIWCWPGSKYAGFPVMVLNTIGADIDFFVISALFLPFSPEQTTRHSDHGQQPPNSRPSTTQPHQHPHKGLCYRRRCRRGWLSRHSRHKHHRSSVARCGAGGHVPRLFSFIILLDTTSIHNNNKYFFKKFCSGCFVMISTSLK